MTILHKCKSIGESKTSFNSSICTLGEIERAFQQLENLSKNNKKALTLLLEIRFSEFHPFLNILGSNLIEINLVGCS